MRASGRRDCSNVRAGGIQGGHQTATAGEGAFAAFTPHEARHVTASHLIDAGVMGLELASVIGHSSEATTKAIYGHLMPNSNARIAETMDAYHGAGAD